MKKLFSLLLALCLLVSLAACGGEAAPATTANAPTETAVDTQPTEPTYTPAWSSGKEALQGKKIIFIGNSYTFWGQTVIFKDQDVLTQDKRSYDHGYFYQLCKANGIDVAVTNWTFGGHNISAMFDGPCDKGDDKCNGEFHEYFIKDPYFDYVCIQPYSEKEYNGDIVAYLKYTMDFFRKANPNVCFLLLVPQMAPEKHYQWFDDIDDLKAEGVRICNWGGMLHDISNGTIEVPGAALPYSRSSFVVSKDDHHENLLAGYLTTLMVYCAITGESPVGQPYDFCDNKELNTMFDLEAFKEKNYPDNGQTNFVEIFRSEADMLGLQQLAEQYLKDFN